MSRYRVYAVGVVTLAACASNTQLPPTPVLQSGVDLQYVDHSVRPQDDLYRYLNGKWFDTFQLPADKGTYGSFTFIDDATQEQLRTIVDGLAQAGASVHTGAVDAAAVDTDVQKITDLYASFMDESRLDALGLKPLQAEFAAIDAITDKGEIAALVAHL